MMVLFLIASALDTCYAFHWMQDHPGTPEQKDELRQEIIGKSLTISCRLVRYNSITSLLHYF